jgi:methionine synthase II (cobalamin-independent)
VTNRATGIGSMPGTDYPESTRVVMGEADELPYLVELPDRGAVASMTGRALAVVEGMAFDLQPAGWRLTGAPGIDHRRAASLLAQDLDTAEELVRGRPAAYKIQIAGPWTLAATVERPRGDKVLADHGARRDLAQALAEGLREHCRDVRRRFGPESLVVQIDEPMLPAVLAGDVATASGFSRHRSVSSHDAAQALTWLADAVHDSAARPVAHCGAADLPFDVFSAVAFEAISFDLTILPRSRYDDLERWLDQGHEAWLGVVPSTHPAGREPSAADLTTRLLRWWADLGYGDVEHLPATTVTPTCGLAGASPTWAGRALALCRETARILSVEQGRMER